MNPWDELRLKIKEMPISQVIGSYIPLNKRGTNFLALCPFHADSKPSLNVNDTKGVFKCFACGAGGDAITFVEKKENITFKESLLTIAKQFGIPTDDVESNRPKNPKFEMGHRLSKVASILYLKVGSQQGSAAYQEFIKNRNLTPEIVDKFKIGFAPANNALTHYLSSLNVGEKDLAIKTAKEIGLIRDGRAQSQYDTFRSRIIFPIWDQFDNVIGFGGRQTLEQQRGKYINSQDSFLFNKRKVLYGLNFAKSSIRNKGQCILVEGYMDAITMHQYQFTQSVAVMGVAIGPTSVKTLSNMGKDIVFGLDSDDAGMRAMTQMQDMFLEEGILPRYLTFAPYKDPDEFLQKESPLDLQKRIDEAPAFLDIQIQNLIPDEIPNHSDKKLDILYQSFQLLKPLKNDLRATERVLSLAKRLGLKSSPEQILEVYKQFLDSQKERKTPRAQVVKQPLRANEQQIEMAENQKAAKVEKKVEKKDRPLSKLEKTLISELVLHPECFKHERMAEVLDFIDHPEVKKVVQALENIFYEVDETEYQNVVKSLIGNEEYALVVRECIGATMFQAIREELDEKRRNKMVLDLLIRLKDKKLKDLRNQLRKKQYETDSEEQSIEIIKELSEVEKQIGLLKTKGL